VVALQGNALERLGKQKEAQQAYARADNLVIQTSRETTNDKIGFA